MVRPSNPRLMSRVLDAIFYLSDGKGSTTHDVLDFVRKTSHRKLEKSFAIEVQRALKHAVNAGLLKLRGGRYKVQIALQHNRVLPSSHYADNKRKMSDTLSEIGDEETEEDANLECGMKYRRQSRSRKGRKRGGQSRRRKRRSSSRKHMGKGKRGIKRMQKIETTKRRKAKDNLKLRKKKIVVKSKNFESFDDEIPINTKNMDKLSKVDNTVVSDDSDDKINVKNRKPNSVVQGKRSSRQKHRGREEKRESYEKANRRSTSRNRNQQQVLEEPMEDTDDNNNDETNHYNPPGDVETTNHDTELMRESQM